MQPTLIESAFMAASLGLCVEVFIYPDDLLLCHRMKLGMGKWAFSCGGGASLMTKNESHWMTVPELFWSNFTGAFGDGCIGNGHGHESKVYGTDEFSQTFKLKLP